MRLQAGCRVHRVQRRVCNYFAFFTEFNWIWTGGAHSHTLTDTHSHTYSTVSTLKHSHTHRNTHLARGGNVNKMDRVKCACGALRCAAACATFAALHYTGFSAPRHIRFNSPSPCPLVPANPPLLPHVAALSAARQCCCAKHNLALHTFERLFLEKLNYEHTTNVKKHGKTKQLRLPVYPVMSNAKM